jgi:hypothetical protein
MIAKLPSTSIVDYCYYICRNDTSYRFAWVIILLWIHFV